MVTCIPHLKSDKFTDKQIEELKKEINKTEYEKAREPLKREMMDLKHEIMDLQNKIEAYQTLVRDLYTSIDIKNDIMTLYIRTNPIEVQFCGKGEEMEVTECPYQPVDIPIKTEFKKSIYRRLNSILNERGKDEE